MPAACLWTVLVTLVVIGLYVEWLMIVGLAREMRVVACGVVALAAAGLCLLAGRIDASLAVLAIGLIATALISPERRNWAAAGFFYAAAAQVASVLVRLDSAKGFVALMFVLLIVWVTDIGGYFAGRGIGGPKLWPRVSPKKTWAGAIGGFVASLAVACGFAAFDLGKAGPLLLLGCGAVGRFAVRRSLRVRGETAVWREGFQSHHPRPWRADGSPGRVCRSRRRGGNFRFLAGWRRWRRPRSYGLVTR